MAPHDSDMAGIDPLDLLVVFVHLHLRQDGHGSAVGAGRGAHGRGGAGVVALLAGGEGEEN